MSFFHSHIILSQKCTGRMKCFKACPTQALRVRNNQVTCYDDLCVDCGECINVCPENVFIPVIDEISDFERFTFKIAIPSRILYTQFGLNIHPNMVHQALLNIGFDAVVDISQITHELSFVISEHLKTETDNQPIISSFCPAVIRLIQVKYPNLMKLVSTFDVPREIAAKESKKRVAKDQGIDINKIGAIYITPCPAMVVSVKQPAEKEKSWLDGAIAIKDIYNLILPEIMKIQENHQAEQAERYFYYGKGWGVLSNESKYLDSEGCMTVLGIENIKMVLDDIEDFKLRNVEYIEAFSCAQGCIGGTFCVENPYISRHNSIMLERRFGNPIDFNKAVILRKYKEKYYQLEHRILPRTTRSSTTDIAASIKRMKQKERIMAKLPNKDCGLCGAPTCETFAQDCAWGEADLSDCCFFTYMSH